MGCDSSGVRIHTNGHAAQLARSVDALPITVGRDIAFGMGQQAPDTKKGLTDFLRQKSIYTDKTCFCEGFRLKETSRLVRVGCTLGRYAVTEMGLNVEPRPIRQCHGLGEVRLSSLAGTKKNNAVGLSGYGSGLCIL
jgi:Domain of unknown function (DUF4157)